MSGLKNSIGSLIAFSYSGFSFVSLSGLWGVILGALSGILGLLLTAATIWYTVEKARFQREERIALQLQNASLTNEDIS